MSLMLVGPQIKRWVRSVPRPRCLTIQTTVMGSACFTGLLRASGRSVGAAAGSGVVARRSVGAVLAAVQRNAVVFAPKKWVTIYLPKTDRRAIHGGWPGCCP